MHSELPPARARDDDDPDDLVARVARYIDDTLAEAVCGPLATLLREHLASGGKRTRARLALGAAEALGLPGEAALGWAAACELLHNATLVHDDIQDGDRVRRGQPALWARHGVGPAINAGDALLMLPLRALERDRTLDDGLRWRLAARLLERALRTAEGQARELALGARLAARPPHETCWAHYVAAAQGKSGPLLALPFEGAALLAGAAAQEARALGDAIEPLGLLYQIHDDVRGLYVGQSGRVRGTDLRGGRVTALVALHLDARPHAHHAPPPRVDDDDDLARLARAFVDDGTLAALVARGHALAATLLEDAALSQRPGLRAIVAQLAARLRDELDETLHATLG